MSLKELLKLKEVQDHFGITVKEEYPFRATLRFAEDITVIGINIDKNQIAVIPYYDGTFHNLDIKEILIDYNIINYLNEHDIEKRNWDLECTWLENWANYEEESDIALKEYASQYSILVLEKQPVFSKLNLKECVDNGELSEMQ